MDEIRRLAFVTVARACGFATLGVALMMVAASFDPGAALRLGGALALLLSLVLILKGVNARRLDHRRTELWLYLDASARPQEAVARTLVGEALREAYLTCARHASAAATMLLTGAMILRLAGA